MTVSSPVAKAVHLTSPGVTEYVFPFKVFKPEELTVDVVTSSAEVIPLALGLDYELDGMGLDPGGAVHLTPSGLSKAGTSRSLVCLRRMDFVQETDYRPQDVFPAETHERALDILTMICQELREKLGRAILAPPNQDTAEQLSYSDLYNIYQEAFKKIKSLLGPLNYRGFWQPSNDYYFFDVVQKEDDHTLWLVVAESYTSGATIAEDIADRNIIPYGAELVPSETNTRWPWVAAEAVATGSVLALPKPYFPGRDVLALFYQGLICVPRKEGVEAAGRYQYEELGEDNALSNQVRVFFDVQVGDLLDMFVISSALSRSVDQAVAMAEAAEAARDRAENARDLAAQASEAALTAAQNAAEDAASATAEEIRAEVEADAQAAQAARDGAEAARDRAESAAGAAAEAAGQAAEEVRDSLAGEVAAAEAARDRAEAAAEAAEEAVEGGGGPGAWLGPQDEYDDLPDSKLEDEKLYFIAEEGGAGGGSAETPTATNEALGLVKGNADEPGKVRVDEAGEMSVNDWDETNYSGAFPAGTFINISSGWVATDDGWVYVDILAAASPGYCTIWTTGGLSLSLFQERAGWSTSGPLPVAKGQTVSLSIASATVNKLQFFPAKGAV
ncbi:hypothetical protein FACS189460_3050 [Deltaproteobacteria bacterium]|nr:hypothetical protein FACS189460_3050 [Deltaproteobacteria bacterium]